MVASANRLKSRHDFRAVFREGIRRNSTHLTLRALRLNHAASILPFAPQAESTIPQTRIGISISLKVSKKAVIRNRIKRQIRAACRELLPKISPGWLLVVVVHPSAAQSECVSKQFLQELEQLLAQAEVLNGHS